MVPSHDQDLELLPLGKPYGPVVLGSGPRATSRGQTVWSCYQNQMSSQNSYNPSSNQYWLSCNQSSLKWELLTTSVVSGSSYALLLVQAPEFTVY